MSVLVPPAVNYPSPLIAVRSRLLTDPPEGPRAVPVEIDWVNMGGAANCVAVNLQNNSTLPFSQIVALKVDNSQCGSDVQFVFTDTTEVLTIPAYTPLAIVPVLTNQLQFFVVALGEEPVDVTRFQILNFVPPPLAIPTSQEQVVATGANIAITGGGAALQVIPATVSGTIESVQLGVAIVSATAAGADSFQLTDGDGKLIGWGSVAASNAQSISGNILNQAPASIRFHNGVKLNQFGGWTPSAAAFLTYNILYRVP